MMIVVRATRPCSGAEFSTAASCTIALLHRNSHHSGDLSSQGHAPITRAPDRCGIASTAVPLVLDVCAIVKMVSRPRLLVESARLSLPTR
jgi:hypothetical protein